MSALLMLLALSSTPPFTIEIEAKAELPPEDAPLRLSLQEVTALALRHNLDLEVQTLAPLEAEAQVLDARARFDPELFGEADVLQEVASQTARATGELFDVEGQSSQARVGVRGELPTGTEIEGGLEHRFDDSNRSPELQTVRLGLSIRQSLLRGFGPRVNEAPIEQARLELRASRWELQAFVEALVVRAERSYWALVLAERERAIVEAGVEVAARELQDVRAAIEVGERARLDDAPVEAELARRRQALIDAESRAAARGLALARLLNLPRLDRPLVTTSTLPRVPERRRLVEARVSTARRLRAVLRQARLQADRQILQTVVTKNGLLPRLDFFVDLGKTGFADGTSAAFAALDSPTYDVRAGLSLSRLLFNRQARSADVRAHADARTAALALENLEREVELEVRLALVELERAGRQVEAAARTRRARARVVEGERARMEAGAGTALLLARAERDLLEARLSEAQAALDHRSALLELHRAEGSLLTRRKVYVGPTP